MPLYEDGFDELTAGAATSPAADTAPKLSDETESEPADLRGIIAEELGEQPSAPAGEPSPAGPKLAAPPAAADDDPFAEPQTPPGPQLTPQQIFEDLGLDVSKLPPEAHGPAAEFIRDWYTTKYAPVARELQQQHEHMARTTREQAQWYESVRPIVESDAYALAASLVQDPQLYARVAAVINGGPAPDMHALGNINEAELDEQSRAIYGIARSTQAENQQLSAALRELQNEVSHLRGGLTTYSQTELARRNEESTARTQAEIQSAVGDYSKRFGFDITKRPEFTNAIRYALRELDAETAAARRENRRPDINGTTLLREGLKRAGFSEIFKRRKQQAGTGTVPPIDRAAGQRHHNGDVLREIVEEEFAAH